MVGLTCEPSQTMERDLGLVAKEESCFIFPCVLKIAESLLGSGVDFSDL